MADLFGVNGNAVAMGNARMQQVRDFNDRVKEHNQNVTDQIQGLREAQKSADTIQAIKTQATNLWVAKDIPGKVNEFNKYFADRAAGTAASNPVANTVANLRKQATSATDGFLSQAKQSTQAVREAVSEGANAGQTVSDVAKTAETAVGKGLTTALSGAGEGVASKVSGVLGKAGVLGSAALGGMDLYEDIKGGGIQGNNNWEKASNLLQIGGTIGDLAGTIFPPAKLIGGVLDLASGLTDTIGEKLDEDKQGSDLTTQQANQTEKTIATPVAETITTGRTQ
jgi:hypothetical protein